MLHPTGADDLDAVHAALTDLHSGGSTAMQAGIALAYQLAERSFVPGHVNRVIVCSDGDANVGNTDPTALSAAIRGYAERGIALTTLGFGAGNYNDAMMERLANDGDGNYFYIDTKREAHRVLVEKMTSTLEVIAKDVKIQVDFDPRTVVDYRLLGYENRDIADDDFRDDAVDTGEIGAGHQVTAVYALHLAPDAPGRLATVRVRNKAPGPDSPAVERRFEVGTDAVRDRYDQASADLRIAAAAAMFADKLRKAPHLDEISYPQLAQLARDAARDGVPEDVELIKLVERAAALCGDRFVQR